MPGWNRFGPETRNGPPDEAVFQEGRTTMNDFSQYQHIGTVGGSDYYAIDPDIMLIVPQGSMVDTPQLAQASADFQNAYARQLGKKCVTVVIMSNILSQDAETRRIYRELAENGLFFGAALVVDNALSRALGSFFIGLSRPQIPMKLFDTVEKSVEWLRTVRP